MKKRLVAVSGIMLMVLGLIAFGMPTTVKAETLDEKIQAAREACEAKGGRFTVSSVSSDGKYFTSTCSADTVNNTTLPTKNNDSSNSGGSSDGSSGGSGGGSDSSSSGSYGSNDNGSGVTWTTDNSQAKSDNGCNGNGVKTNLFGDGCVSGTDGIFAVLNVILNVLTWGVGIAGTLGIVITGITYMTAKDDITQMTKAKNRLIQIIIGLAVYAVMWGFLQWLLPGGIFGN